MKIYALWTITFIILAGLFVAANAPFVGTFFLAGLLVLGIALNKHPKEPSLNKPVLLPAKIGLAISFFVLVGYNLFMYLNNINCLDCRQSIHAANAKIPLFFIENEWKIVGRSGYSLYQKPILFLIGCTVVALTYAMWPKHKKKGKKHA